MSKQYLRLLQNEDLKKIHNASLTLLQNTGMLIDHYKARKMLEEAGADVDDEKKIVKFPPELVEKCLKTIPQRLTYAGRDPENDIILQAGGGIYARTASSLTSYLDLETRRYRRGTIDDLNQWTVLVDALPNINCCGTNHAEDVPAKTADIHSTRVLLSNQRKHFFAASFNVKNLKYMIEMAVAVRGSKEVFKKRPLFHSVIGIISPLSIPEDDVNMIFLAAEYRANYPRWNYCPGKCGILGCFNSCPDYTSWPSNPLLCTSDRYRYVYWCGIVRKP
jgi:trimethylamine--corrinoid protein Co-methyltransferase